MSYREVGQRLGEQAKGSLEEILDSGSREVEAAVSSKLDQMLGAVKRGVQEGDLSRFKSVDEERILRFVPDKRRPAGLGLLTLGLLTLVLLPGWLKVLALPALLLGVLVFAGRYLNNARVDVPDGYTGVLCRYGQPIGGRQAKTGRNWLYRFDTFIPFLVSQRDQVVDLEDANFTADYASISLSQQLAFRVVEPAVFVERSSPGNIMKILSLYAGYLNLRIITSIEDARVKFSGRDRIDNIIGALNDNLRATYGIEIVRGSMPSANNDILLDLEAIRTLLKEIEAMTETQQVRVEAAVKQVESQLRTRRKETRSRAFDLQQAKVRLDTSVAEQVGAAKQTSLVRARQELEAAASEVRRELATLKAREQKNQGLQDSVEGLELEFRLRLAELRERYARQLLPEQIEVLSVKGLGSGLTLGRALSEAGQLFKALPERRDSDT